MRNLEQNKERAEMRAHKWCAQAVAAAAAVTNTAANAQSVSLLDMLSVEFAKRCL